MMEKIERVELAVHFPAAKGCLLRSSPPNSTTVTVAARRWKQKRENAL